MAAIALALPATPPFPSIYRLDGTDPRNRQPSLLGSLQDGQSTHGPAATGGHVHREVKATSLPRPRPKITAPGVTPCG